MSQISRYFGICVISITLILGSEVQAAQPWGLVKANSCQSVKERLIDVLTDAAMRRRPYYRRYGRRIRGRGRDPRVSLQDRAVEKSAPKRVARKSANRPAATKASGAASEAGPSHYTKTNNQVDGVDEADQVKSDGRYLYTIYNKEVLILKSWPANETSIIARYRVKNGFTPRYLFLRGDQLMVLSNGYRHRYKHSRRPSWWSGRYTTMSRVSLLDIKTRNTPKLLASVELEGSILQARMIGANAYIVSNDAINLPHAFWRKVWNPTYRKNNKQGFRPWGAPARRHISPYSYNWSYSAMRRRVKDALRGIPVEHLLPSIGFYGSSDNLFKSKPLHRCQDLYIPRGPSRLGILSLTQLSFNGGSVKSAGIMSNGQKLYASMNNLYVSTTAYRWRWSRRWRYNGTQIHKFSLKNGPRYRASGLVDGYLLNQFSMDEHQNHLRVATTSNGWGWRSGGRAGNNLFVLKQRGRQLKVVGEVSGLAPGERIYAARMMGDKGYVVTFRRTDPLYTLDLSNPREPKVVGELKINGFSSYIHPIAKDKLLTVGQDADDRGRIKGAHLQIFDVSNMKKPTRTHHYLLTEGFRSSSSAQYDHHAFTFDSRSGTLSLPLNVTSPNRWTGIILVKVNEAKGFNYLGTVDHKDLVSYNHSKYQRRHHYRSNWMPINRSVFIDKFIFTLSRIGLKAHDLANGKPKQVASLRYDQRKPIVKPAEKRPWH